MSGTFFREDLVMKMFLRPLIQEEQLSVNDEECTLSTYAGNLPLEGLPRNSVVIMSPPCKGRETYCCSPCVCGSVCPSQNRVRSIT